MGLKIVVNIGKSIQNRSWELLGFQWHELTGLSLVQIGRDVTDVLPI